jgi:hypothetical protein
MQVEGLSQLKIIHLIGPRTRDLPACSIVPQPTTLPRSIKFVANMHAGNDYAQYRTPNKYFAEIMFFFNCDPVTSVVRII